MKQFLYLLTFTISAGTIGLLVTQPQLFQPSGPLFMSTAEGSQDSRIPEPAAGEEQLAKFLSDYPHTNNGGVAPTYTVAQASPPVAAPPAGFASTRRRPLPPMNDSEVGFASTSGKIPANDSSATFGLFDQWSEPPAPPVPTPQPPAPQPVPPVAPVPPITPVPPAMPPAWVSPQSTQGQATPGQATPHAAPIPSPSAFQTPPAPAPTTAPVTAPVTPPPSTRSPIAPRTENAVDPFLAALGGPIPPTASVPAPAPPQAPAPFAPFSVPPSTTAAPGSEPIPSTPSPQVSLPPATTAVSPTRSLPERQTLPPSLPSPVSDRSASQFQINPSIMAEEVPCHGTEMVARVGTEVVLMCDILPQMRRMAHQVFRENLKQATEEQRQQISPEEKEHFLNTWIEVNYPAFLRKQVEDALVYNDFKMSKGREERNMIEKKMGEEFDLQDVSGMMKEFGVSDIVELKTYLKDELGSSLDRERLLTVRSRIAQQWAMANIQHAEGECTHDEMMEYYTANRKEFETKARCRWKEMVVLFSSHQNEKEAWDKIVWMGNKVVGGVSFEEIAKNNSDGFTAIKGGLWDWTSKGSLTSEDVEKAIFTLPVGKLSPILKSDKGLHIVQVVEREDDKVTPFVEAQVVIRQKIQIQRRNRHADEYFEELRRRYPAIVLREKIDFNLNRNISAKPSLIQ